MFQRSQEKKGALPNRPRKPTTHSCQTQGLQAHTGCTRTARIIAKPEPLLRVHLSICQRSISFPKDLFQNVPARVLQSTRRPVLIVFHTADVNRRMRQYKLRGDHIRLVDW